MANHKSAIKRAKQSQQRTLINKARKTGVKTITQKVEAAVAENSPEEARARFTAAQKLIAQTAAKGTIHKNTAARKISRLSKMVNSLTG
ncbi:MAG: 30S ribosomal protein S20 [Desulfosudaceae bacterium]